MIASQTGQRNESSAGSQARGRARRRRGIYNLADICASLATVRMVRTVELTPMIELNCAASLLLASPCEYFTYTQRSPKVNGSCSAAAAATRFSASGPGALARKATVSWLGFASG